MSTGIKNPMTYEEFMDAFTDKTNTIYQRLCREWRLNADEERRGDDEVDPLYVVACSDALFEIVKEREYYFFHEDIEVHLWDLSGNESTETVHVTNELKDDGRGQYVEFRYFSPMRCREVCFEGDTADWLNDKEWLLHFIVGKIAKTEQSSASIELEGIYVECEYPF